MIFGKPIIDIKPIDAAEETVAIFGYGEDSNEILITNKRIYRNTKDEFVANELIVGLSDVRYTNFRFCHSKQRRIPWTGIALLAFAVVLCAITIAMDPYIISAEVRDFLFPVLYTLIGAIAFGGIAMMARKISKQTMPHGTPKGVIYIHYSDDKPLRIFIFEKDIGKIREAHYKINAAIAKEKLKQMGKI